MKSFTKYLIVTLLSIFALSTSVFAESIEINIDSNNSTITVKDIQNPIYAIQIELVDENSNSYTFKENSNFYYSSMIVQSSKIILLIDEINGYLASSGDLVVGVLSSTSKPNFSTTATLTLVDENLKSTKKEVTVEIIDNATEPEEDNKSDDTPSDTPNEDENTSDDNEDGNTSDNNEDENTSGDNEDNTTDEENTSTSNTSSSSSSGSGSSISVATEETETTEAIEELEEIENLISTTENVTLTMSNIKLPETLYSTTFSDLTAFSWAESSIEKLASKGIINGDGKGSFNPSGNSKRADVVIMLVKLLGLENTKVTVENFTDVSNDKYYVNFVGIAKQLGIVNGNNGYFNPEENISRQDTMVMVANILKQLEITIDTNESTLETFKDFNEISSYAKESVAILVNLGIINGSDGQINPKNAVTRAEMSIIISNLYDLLENEINA